MEEYLPGEVSEVMTTRKNQTAGAGNQKNPGAVSAAQFAALRARVKKLERWKEEFDAIPAAPGRTEEVPEESSLGGRLGKFRGFVKRNPVFWTAGCLMAGYVLGCLICDFSTFGRY